jgi:hypothetical protein
MNSLFKGQSEWQKNKDVIILKRIEKNPAREKELLELSDKADKLITELREHNHEIEKRNIS